MIDIKNKENCSGCHGCYSACPRGCIEMVADDEGFLYPSVNEKECIKCGLCIKACPIIAPHKSTKNEEDIKAYGAYNRDEATIKSSSSGGAFTLIAEWIINNGGVVFGASFNDDFSVSHKGATTKEELNRFRGSKYVQSTIGNTYKEAKELLGNGRLVLFTGTPCQIGGLYSYLGKGYDNLITQDIVCHGVPAPMVWQGYRKYQENKEGSKIKAVSFRNKDSGWKSYSVAFEFENGNKYRQKSGSDLFIKSFLADLCLRPSCYNCSFKGKVRESDITLADFWGVERVMPEMYNDKGVSLVLVSSKKGEGLFDDIKGSTVFKAVSIDEALKYNSASVHSAKKPKDRDLFMKMINEQGFLMATRRYLKNDTFLTKVKRKIKSIIRKIKK